MNHQPSGPSSPTLRRSQLGKKATIVLGLVVGVAAFFHLAKQASHGGVTTPLGSSLRYDPYGVALWHDWLDHRGVDVIRLKRPRFEADDQGTLVQIVPDNPDFETVYSLPTDQVLQWLSDGNDVVLVTPWATPLLDKLGIHAAPAPGSGSNPSGGQTTGTAGSTNHGQPATRRTSPPSTQTHGGGPHTTVHGPHTTTHTTKLQDLANAQRLGEPPADLPIAPATTASPWGPLEGRLAQAWDIDHLAHIGLTAETLLQNKAGQPTAFRVHVPQGFQFNNNNNNNNNNTPPETTHNATTPSSGGSGGGSGGTLTVLGDVFWVNNWGLQQQNNLVFVGSLVDETQPVWFDEWGYGIGHPGTILEIMLDLGMGPALVLGLLWLFMYRWSQNGMPATQTPEPKRERLQGMQIEGLAAMYANGLNPAERMRRVARMVQQRLAEACQCQPAQLTAVIGQKMQDPHAPSQTLLAAQELAAQTMAWEHNVQAFCPKCQYNLTGSPVGQSTNCPECDTLLGSERQNKNTGKPVKTKQLAQALTDAHTVTEQLAPAKRRVR